MHKLATFTAVAALLAVPAYAADLGYPAAPVYTAPAPVATNWTGFYLGAFGGLAASTDALNVTPPPGAGIGPIDINVTGNGWLGGVRAGYDYDLGGVVLGAFASIAASDIGAQIDGTIAGAPGGGAASLDIHSKLNMLGTIEGRIGAGYDNLLGYVHGGYAFGHSEASASLTVPGGGPALSGSTEQDRSGFVIGAGLEYRVSDQLSLTTEYGYYDLGTEAVADLGGVPLNDHLTFSAITAGLNFRF